MRYFKLETALAFAVMGLLLLVGNGLAIGPYTDNGDQTVTDQGTGLMWENGNNVTTPMREWANALAYCENLTLGGYTDWRLPNILELGSIVDYNKKNPAIDPVFSAASDYYWSSTSNASEPYRALSVDFRYGNIFLWLNKNMDAYVRCVRGGLYPSFYPLTISIADGDSTDIVTSNVGDIACHGGSPNSGTCADLYTDITTVTLRAIPGSGHALTGWGIDCSACGDSRSCNVTIGSGKRCLATFEPTWTRLPGGTSRAPALVWNPYKNMASLCVLC